MGNIILLGQGELQPLREIEIGRLLGLIRMVKKQPLLLLLLLKKEQQTQTLQKRTKSIGGDSEISEKTDLLILKQLLSQLVRKISQDIFKGQKQSSFCWTGAAMLAIHMALKDTW